MPPSPYESLPMPSQETSNAKPIAKEIRADVLKLLRLYYEAVMANGPTPSEASQTTAPPHSTASGGTSLSEMTSTFSVGDEAVQGERSTVPLNPVVKTRKALMRKLEACRGDCNQRKVKCKLWHHALNNLLGPKNPNDKFLVEWALKIDAEPSYPISSTRVANFVAGEPSGVRDEALDQATNVFDVPPAPPLLYGPGIHETTASLLDTSRAASPRPRPRPRPGLVNENAAPPRRFSTKKINNMFPVGMRDSSLGALQFKCQYSECAHTSDSERLVVHFDATHFRFTRLSDPFRVVCPTCNKFYALLSAECCPRVNPLVVEKLYGLYPPETPMPNSTTNAGPIPSFGWGLPGSYFMNALQNGGRPSTLNHVSHNQGDAYDYGYGSYNSLMSNLCMDSTNRYRSTNSSRSMIDRVFGYLSSYISFIAFPFRKLRQLARGRRYKTTFAAAVLIFIVFGCDWILSKFAQRSSPVSAGSNLNLPFVGVVVMSIAFALHRFAVHAHRYAGARSGSWLSRCAIDMFNVACGRPTDPGQVTYGPGHSMLE